MWIAAPRTNLSATEPLMERQRVPGRRFTGQGSATGIDGLPGCLCDYVAGCLATDGHRSWPTPTADGFCTKTATTRTASASSTTGRASTSN